MADQPKKPPGRIPGTTKIIEYDEQGEPIRNQLEQAPPEPKAPPGIHPVSKKIIAPDAQ